MVRELIACFMEKLVKKELSYCGGQSVKDVGLNQGSALDVYSSKILVIKIYPEMRECWATRARTVAISSLSDHGHYSHQDANDGILVYTVRHNLGDLSV